MTDRHRILFFLRIIAGVVGTVVLILGVYLIDRVGRRRLLLIGAIGMSICEFIVAIVGVTAGHVNPVTQAVNLPAQKVLVVFVCMWVFSILILLFWMLTSFRFSRYIAFFSLSWGPVVWVITGEIFVKFSSHLINILLIPQHLFLQPLATRAKGMSLSVASNWIWNFGIGYATPYLVNASSTGLNGIKAANLGVKVFFIWGGTCVGCFIFT